MTMRTAIRGVLAITAVGVAFGLAAAEDRWLLRLNLGDGQAHRMVTTQKQKIHMDLGAMGSQEMESSTRLEMSQTVTERRPDGSVDIETTLDRMVMEFNQGPMAMRIDSSETPVEGSKPDPYAGMFKGMIGHPFTVSMTSLGEVTAVSGLKDALDGMIDELPDDPAARQLFESIRGGFSPDAMKSMIQHSVVVYPSEAVSSGQSWTHRAFSPHPMLGQMDIETTYKAEGSEMKNGHDCVRLASAIRMKVEGPFPFIEQMKKMFQSQSQEIDFDISMDETTGSGTLWISRDTGLVVDLDLNVRMGIDMSFAIPIGEDVHQQTMRMDVEMINHTQLVE